MSYKWKRRKTKKKTGDYTQNRSPLEMTYLWWRDFYFLLGLRSVGLHALGGKKGLVSKSLGPLVSHNFLLQDLMKARRKSFDPIKYKLIDWRRINEYVGIEGGKKKIKGHMFAGKTGYSVQINEADRIPEALFRWCKKSMRTFCLTPQLVGALNKISFGNLKHKDILYPFDTYVIEFGNTLPGISAAIVSTVMKKKWSDLFLLRNPSKKYLQITVIPSSIANYRPLNESQREWFSSKAREGYSGKSTLDQQCSAFLETFRATPITVDIAFDEIRHILISEALDPSAIRSNSSDVSWVNGVLRYIVQLNLYLTTIGATVITLKKKVKALDKEGGFARIKKRRVLFTEKPADIFELGKAGHFSKPRVIRRQNEQLIEQNGGVLNIVWVRSYMRAAKYARRLLGPAAPKTVKVRSYLRGAAYLLGDQLPLRYFTREN